MVTKRTAFGITSLLTFAVVLASGALAGHIVGGPATLTQVQAENAALREQVQTLLERERVYDDRLRQANAAISGAAANTAATGRPQVFEPPTVPPAIAPSQTLSSTQTAAPAAPSRERDRRSREQERYDD